MKWRKLGKIFDPTQHKLANGCVEYAQSPQALVFDDYVRIYFSTRRKDPANGKYFSHISFVDMSADLAEIISVSSHTVIELGALGCFDEHGIFPLNVLKNGSEVYGYIGGWNRRVSVSVDTSIGLAVSRDNGATFKRTGDGPVLTSSLKEPFLVGDPFVTIFNKKFHMWYIFGLAWKKFSENQPPERIYKIGQAVSADGITWQKKEEGRQIIADRIGVEESQALPTVAYFNGCYHMFFCYRESFDFRTNKRRSYRIGYACSDDLINWTRNDPVAGIDVSEGSWDSDMICYPHVFHCREKVYLLYNGNEFGRFGFGLAVLEQI
ncbi:MAG: hypothetical protein CVU54_16010 [Deltaproteobacteria bacterium HGW-Deltaproteobacteria-12]|jgi:hypothetical protein|nr:MAG: hypothetical protein CVU54_16010 [Deltaproteobacteria bacterium HGW-Deltaproteobacteria-12]